MSARRLAVFDVDGTLIDSQDLIVAAMARAFEETGHACPPRAEVLAIVGLSLPEAMAVLAPHLAAEIRDDLIRHYRDGFVSRREAATSALAPLYPGARDALDRLSARRDAVMGIATGKARPGLDHLFATHPIGHYFATTQTADAHPSKPHPSMLLRALAETGCPAERAVMIGDTEYDMAMGKAAGYATIGVTWGYHPRARLAAAGADVLIDGYDALDSALAALWDA
jgi:phosphoglycolate phosphatase